MLNDHKILLLVPKGARGISDIVWNQLHKSCSSSDLFQIVDFDMTDIISGDEKKDPRDKAGGKARFLMHQMEIDIIKSTDDFRDENNWLIIDGAVKLGDFVSSPFSIGVAKSFRCFLTSNDRF